MRWTAERPLRIAILNRGEPAVRALNSIAELAIAGELPCRSIALFTDPDADSAFVRRADEAYHIGPAQYLDPADGRSKHSYLDQDRIEAALHAVRADAVWVGWGFLAEDATFAARCEGRGIVFIGPSSAAMARLADKIEAKRVAEGAGVPVVAWSGGPVDDAAAAAEHAARIGYPLMIKAAAGGGGRGIREVCSPGELAGAFASARAEAAHAFGDPTLFLERRVDGGRHLEVQILADGFGTIWVLGVRECSLQRRRQKVLEESAPAFDRPDVVARLRDHARALCAAVGYINAGTVEFLYQPETDQIAFMEVNTRLQVEHTVTEAVTGVDLVRKQIEIACGYRLQGDEPAASGHAVEVRLNAEDPDRGFAPAPGRVALARFPAGPGIRVDSGIGQGDVIPPDFDSMIAKIIAWGDDRGTALARLARALQHTDVVIEGGTTNKSFLLELVRHPKVVSGDFHTAWIESRSDVPTASPGAAIALLTAAVAAYDADIADQHRELVAMAHRGRVDARSPQPVQVDLRYGGRPYRFRVAKRAPQRYRVAVDGGGTVDVTARRAGPVEWRLTLGGERHHVLSTTRGGEMQVEVGGAAHRIERDEGGIVRATSPAVVVALLVASGDEVSVGEPLLVLESMKMETRLSAPVSGRVGEVAVAPGTKVGRGDVLLRLEAGSDDVAPDFTPVRFDHGTDAENPAAALEALLLGFDVEPVAVPTLTVASAADVLALFADLCELDPPGVEELARGARIDDPLLARLRGVGGESSELAAVLSHLGDVEEGEALLRLAWSRRQAKLQDGAIRQLLLDWSGEPRNLPPEGRLRLIALLDRIARVGGRRSASAASLATMLSTRLAELDAASLSGAQPLPDLAKRLDRLATMPASKAEAAMAALAEEPQPWTGWLLPWLHTFRPPTIIGRLLGWARGSSRLALLRALGVVARISYRHLELHFDGELPGRAPIVAADASSNGRRLRLIWALVGNDIGRDHLREIETAATGSNYDELRVELLLIGARAGDRATAERMARVVLRRLPRAAMVVLGFSAAPGSLDIHVVRSSGAPPTAADSRLHPGFAERCETWRLAAFDAELLDAGPAAALIGATARANPRDRRLVVLTEIRDVEPTGAEPLRFPALERALRDALDLMRRHQLAHAEPPHWNRVVVRIEPIWQHGFDRLAAVGSRIAAAARHLHLEQLMLRVRVADQGGATDRVVILSVTEDGVQLGSKDPSDAPWRALTDADVRRVGLRWMGLPHPTDILRTLTSPGASYSDLPPGSFTEHDLDGDGRLSVVERPPGGHAANLVVGVVENCTSKHPEGVRRVLIIGDPSRSLGSLGEAECRRVIAALDLAERLAVPVEWFALSSGARVSMDSGTENMDWTARALRRIVTFTQAGGEVNVVVTGINVGAQSYWNAEATMLMHTRGMLVMVGDAAMVLTGKQALDYSGAVSAESNAGIGGYERIMGPNGEAQHWAPTIEAACALLFRHYDYTWIAPGEDGPRRRQTADGASRDVGNAPLAAVEGSDFEHVADAFDPTLNDDRKKPFDIRSVMCAVADADDDPLERWPQMRDAEMAVVWDAHVGGAPVRMIGIEAHERARHGVPPVDGPHRWTAGTLFPRASKKIARGINAASGNRPVVVLATLSGFDGSPESMRELQLEYGAEIGRAVVNFVGPIVFVVLSRYHGGAFVVFSKALNEGLRSLAVEGAYASVLGGAPAAAVVFAREVEKNALADPSVSELRRRLAHAADEARPALAVAAEEALETARNAARARLAAAYDTVHTIERARRVGSIDRIIELGALRAEIIDAMTPSNQLQKG